jgi:hypothetical protein
MAFGSHTLPIGQLCTHIRRFGSHTLPIGQLVCPLSVSGAASPANGATPVSPPSPVGGVACCCVDPKDMVKRINYVCTTCSSTFTRKASGLRHNSNMHRGTAGIVRLIDYITGRISGQYLQCNPRDFRLMRRERLGSKNHSQETKTSSDNLLDSLNDYAELKRAVNGNRNLGRSVQGRPFLLDFERISNKTTLTLNFESYEYEQARAELVAIEQMLAHYYDREFALDTVISLINESNARGNYRGIHEAFKNHRRNIRNQFGYV